MDAIPVIVEILAVDAKRLADVHLVSLLGLWRADVENVHDAAAALHFGGQERRVVQDVSLERADAEEREGRDADGGQDALSLLEGLRQGRALDPIERRKNADAQDPADRKRDALKDSVLLV